MGICSRFLYEHEGATLLGARTCLFWTKVDRIKFCLDAAMISRATGSSLAHEEDHVTKVMEVERTIMLSDIFGKPC